MNSINVSTAISIISCVVWDMAIDFNGWKFLRIDSRGKARGRDSIKMKDRDSM
jgi:hypothetical protein